MSAGSAGHISGTDMSRRAALGLGGASLLTLATGPVAAARPGEAVGGATAAQPALRGAWIATVDNIDWPSQPGLPDAQQQAELIALLDQCQAVNLNAVFIQVRPTTDAFYPSEYAPWSHWLTGEQGKGPGYDPLAFMIEHAHARDLELHAWFNPYRVSKQPDLNKLAPGNPARRHPEWVVRHGDQLWFDPGLPEVRQLIIASILEVVGGYEIDAVHFDDYFYPYPISGVEFADEETYQRYGADEFTDKGDWRRHNVNTLVRELPAASKQLKPRVKFGISPFGIWRNESTDPRGSATSGLESYDAIYADSRSWVTGEWIDYVVPQIYWAIGFPPAAYDVLVPWWSALTKDRNVHLYVGQGLYKLGRSDQSPGWSDPEEMPGHLTFNRERPPVKGDVYFSMKDLERNPLGFTERLRTLFYAEPVPVPDMPWLDDSRFT